MFGILAQVNGIALIVISIVALLLSIAGGFAAVILIPGNYFSRRKTKVKKSQSTSWPHILLRIGKNILGVGLFILGAIMFITPGPGIIFLILGLSLVDIPGKHRFERYLITRPAVLRSINRIRTYFNRPKLVAR